MSLHIPPEHIAIIKRWLDLPDEELAKFSAALRQAGPRFNAAELAKCLIPQPSISPDLVYGIVQVLISVYRTGEPEKPFERFLDRDVKPALERMLTFSEGKEAEQWTQLRAFLLDALSLERVIGTTAKAGVILTEHERIFESAKIMSDFRPIFHADCSEKPDAGVVVHMLKITHRDKFDRKFDAYYALDSNDLEKMKRTLERASQKEKTLRETMADAGLTVLDVKSHY